MDDVIVQKLSTHEQVEDGSGVVGDSHPNRVLGASN
jgi:hypothetical protein